MDHDVALAAGEPRLEHERLQVYAVALELHARACALLPGRTARVLRDQLERASLGIVLRVRGLAPLSQCSEARGLAVRVVQMLSRLVGPAR